VKLPPIVTLAAAAGLALTGAAFAKTAPDSASSASFAGHRLAGQASVSLVDARSIALKARPGVITDQELEHERGGSGLRYSFDVKSGGVKYEVGVDAKTGKVLENGVDSDAD
jgi:uncharacterized membrane protein YkoI